ncbi:MAG: hypothetical protein JXA28_10230 [Bacteroidetes bacterium]|nr:hypothetical protein [Bacteroidota bacterium]
MATLPDILSRTAANIGMDAGALRPYVEALIAIVAEAHTRNEAVELMTFGTLEAPGTSPPFRAHATLLPSGDGEES